MKINANLKNLYNNYIGSNNKSKADKLLKKDNLFDLNGDGKVNVDDILLASSGFDIDGDGKVSKKEQNFLKKYKSNFMKSVLNSMQGSKTSSYSDILKFEEEIAKLSAADKKTFAKEIKTAENKLIENIKKNIDLNKDGKINKKDYEKFLRDTYDYRIDNGSKKLTNGKELSVIMNEIESAISSAVLKKCKNVKQKDLTAIKKQVQSDFGYTNKLEKLLYIKINSSNYQSATLATLEQLDNIYELDSQKVSDKAAEMLSEQTVLEQLEEKLKQKEFTKFNA